VHLKAQKKAQVEAELKDAISALKKPNRTLAVKDYIEAAEMRASVGQLKSTFLRLSPTLNLTG
jgi:DNA replication regulator SLD3